MISSRRVCRQFTHLADGYLEHIKPEDGKKIRSMRKGLDFTYAKDDQCLFRYSLTVLEDNRICLGGGEFPESDPDNCFYRPFLKGCSVTMRTGDLHSDGLPYRGLEVGLDSDGTYVLFRGFHYTLWLDGKAIADIVPCESKDKLLHWDNRSKKRSAEATAEIAKKAIKTLEGLVEDLTETPSPSQSFAGVIKGEWSEKNRRLRLYMTPLLGFTVNHQVVDGDVPFSLKDAFGFPWDMNVEICGTNSLSITVKNAEKKFILGMNKWAEEFKRDINVSHKKDEEFTLKYEDKVLMVIKCVD